MSLFEGRVGPHSYINVRRIAGVTFVFSLDPPGTTISECCVAEDCVRIRHTHFE